MAYLRSEPCGEIGQSHCHLRSLVYLKPRSRRVEGEVGVDQSSLVGERIQVARQQNLQAVPDWPCRDRVDRVKNVGHAVVGEGIIKGGLLLKHLRTAKHVQKHCQHML